MGGRREWVLGREAGKDERGAKRVSAFRRGGIRQRQGGKKLTLRVQKTLPKVVQTHDGDDEGGEEKDGREGGEDAQRPPGGVEEGPGGWEEERDELVHGVGHAAEEDEAVRAKGKRSVSEPKVERRRRKEQARTDRDT